MWHRGEKVRDERSQQCLGCENSLLFFFVHLQHRRQSVALHDIQIIFEYEDLHQLAILMFKWSQSREVLTLNVIWEASDSFGGLL